MLNTLKSISSLIKLKKNLKLSRGELETIQLTKLRALIKHAYENVPYYRRLFDSVKIKPEEIKKVEDLRKLPITDKSTMRSMDRTDITAKNIDLKKCVEVFTSGSTGMPTNILFTWHDYNHIDLVYLRSFLKNGLRFMDKRVFILDPHSFDTKKCWYHAIGLARNINISCFLDPEEQLKVLKETRPGFIHGYPSSLSQVSRLMIDIGTKDIRPSLVSTAAELLQNKDREVITAAFGTIPYDRYAARECGNIAWECYKHNGYHINIDSVVIEFTRDDRPVNPGESGDVVVTNLHSYAMPFIRYRLGDVGVPSEDTCACGLDFPLMKIIEGRDEDFILLKGDRMVSPMMITGTLDHIPGIKQFRVIQEDLCSLVVIIAKKKDFGPNTVFKVKKRLKDILGEDITIECQVVDNIPRDPSGKVRSVISKISSRYKI